MSKSNSKIVQEQIEFLENAQKRIRQKKILYYHFIFFLFVSGFLFVLDFILNIGSDLILSEYTWSLWVFLIWIFLFLFHTFNVFVSNRFLGDTWVKKQTRLLMELQKHKIEELKKDITNEAKIIANSYNIYNLNNGCNSCDNQNWINQMCRFYRQEFVPTQG